MRQINRDSLPHLTECLLRMISIRTHTFLVRLIAWWWGVTLKPNCLFNGSTKFRRHPGSSITIGEGSKFNSTTTSNYIGVNRPCIITTLSEGARVRIGSNCGFSGTVIGCASEIIIGDDVMCGANTLITDTDWHTDDPRSGFDEAVMLEKGVWLGVNVTVLKGVTIGENTLVAAGSIVVKSLPGNVIAGGIPAKILKQIKKK